MHLDQIPIFVDLERVVEHLVDQFGAAGSARPEMLKVMAPDHLERLRDHRNKQILHNDAKEENEAYVERDRLPSGHLVHRVIHQNAPLFLAGCLVDGKECVHQIVVLILQMDALHFFQFVAEHVRRTLVAVVRIVRADLIGHRQITDGRIFCVLRGEAAVLRFVEDLNAEDRKEGGDKKKENGYVFQLILHLHVDHLKLGRGHLNVENVVEQLEHD